MTFRDVVNAFNMFSQALDNASRVFHNVVEVF